MAKGMSAARDGWKLDDFLALTAAFCRPLANHKNIKQGTVIAREKDFLALSAFSAAPVRRVLCQAPLRLPGGTQAALDGAVHEAAIGDAGVLAGEQQAAAQLGLRLDAEEAGVVAGTGR